MTTVQTAGAVSREAAEWFAIDWQTVSRNVRRLQVRIVQAWKAGKWNKVKALQRLLSCSYSGTVSCRSTSDGKCWQANPRSGRRNLGHSGEEGKGSSCTEAERLSSSTAQTCLHPEKVRQQNDAPSRHSHHEGQSDASITSARPRPHWLRIQTRMGFVSSGPAPMRWNSAIYHCEAEKTRSGFLRETSKHVLTRLAKSGF